MFCVPVIGSNIPPLTPVPLYVPPAGDPPLSVTIPPLSQTGDKEENVTVGAVFTGKVCVALPMHPLASIYMYMMDCAPPEGSNILPVTFVPMNIPPVGDSPPVSETEPPLSHTRSEERRVGKECR